MYTGVILISRGRAVGIANTLRVVTSGDRIPAGARDFSPLRNVQNGSGAHPASYANEYQGSIPAAKLSGREVNN